MKKTDRNIRILFLGQCHLFGYEGVSGSETYPQVVQSILSTRFPQVNFEFDTRFLPHLRGLKAMLRDSLTEYKPDIALIFLTAAYVSMPWRVSLLHEIAPEVMRSARSFLQKIDSRIRSDRAFEKLFDRVRGTGLGPVVMRPPITVDEYERLVKEAILFCQSKSSCQLVLIGPEGFNNDTKKGFGKHTPELCSSVNEMVHRLGKQFGLPVVDTLGAFGEYSGEVFLRAGSKFSSFGHEVVAREISRLLASQISLKDNL